jgi:hypothetical protein
MIEHHSPEDAANQRRLIDEIFGRAQRQWPDGRISGDDDGVTAYAIAADIQHRMVRIQFTKPMLWLGLDVKSAKALRDMLDEKLSELAKAEISKHFE